MASIKATIVKTQLNTKGVATITVEYDDGKGKWQKTYENAQTSPIDFGKFKETITADLRKDLKTKDQLTNLNKEVGKQFIITI